MGLGRWNDKSVEGGWVGWGAGEWDEWNDNLDVNGGYGEQYGRVRERDE